MNIIKIKETNCKNKWGYNCSYILENGIELYDLDWNGEKYNCGYDRKNEITTDNGYKPIFNLNFEIIGFDEYE